MNYWQGTKIRLRGTEPSDAEAFYHWNLDSEMGRNLDFLWPPTSRALVQKQVDELAVKLPDNDAFTWIMENAAGNVVGSIATHHCDRRSGVFSYGLNVLPEHQRKGYASEAIRMILRYYFEELRYHKANVQVFSYNPASIALHETLGFVKEGVLRESLFSAGAFHDVLCYGMTRTEWDRSVQG